MNCTGTNDCLCGCCAGTSVQTPQIETNLPAQSSINYRAGTWASFKETMLARLSSSDYPALARLKTRADDDFTIAFLDATAVVLDILTFYQERLANENYLGTATQSRSLTELSRLIGYQPSPGVSASVYVAFTLKAAPGQPPDPTAPAITIPAGTETQSIPAQGQTPQVFETSADIPAKPDWNALSVQTAAPWQPGTGSTSMYLQGTSTQLNPGDSLLILGVAREAWAENPTGDAPPDDWDVVVLNEVQADTVRNITYVAWDQPLTHITDDGGSSGWTVARVFALRQKAALFGNNAPDPNLFVNAQSAPGSPTTGLPNYLVNSSSTPWQWASFQITSSSQVDLDSTYPKVVAGGWFAVTQKNLNLRRFVLRRNGLAGGPGFPESPLYTFTVQLYNVQHASAVSLAQFGLSAKVTELVADYVQDISNTFSLRAAQVWAQSEQLAVAPQPLDYPLYGGFLDLQSARPDLVGATVVAISGNRQKIAVADGVTWLSFVPDDQSAPTALEPGDLLTITAPAPLPLNADSSAPDWSSVTGSMTLRVEDANGRPGAIPQASLSNFTLALSSSSDPEVSEYALVKSVNDATAPYAHTQILLQSNLLNCYDRNSATVNANVALATNGRSVSEIIGSGSASTPNQNFTLKQSPLTYVQAPTPTGRKSTLQVLANGAAWSEVPSLYNQRASAQVFATLNQSDGTTDVLFGDGVEGATLPTGQNNLQANYRVGVGSAGNVATGAISILIDRPVGVSGVTNPQAATGGGDPDSIDDIRSSAPQSVLTLGRAVSIADYQSYASTFAGIAKAYATWIPSGPGRGVFLTVAGANGAALPPGNPTLANLVASLRNYGNPLVSITAVTFLETLFGLDADIAYDPAYSQPAVQAAVLQTLTETYSFANRTFGQGVSADEVTSVIQAVPGVLAVNVTNLEAGATSAAGDLAGQGTFSLSTFNSWLAQQVPNLPRPASGSNLRICPYIPVASSQGLPQAAEILVIDPNPKNVVLGVMS
ncbi:MAG: putative baseplate assembly protein [Terriglobia bacterium]|jgi:hypothetical protein